MIKREKVEPTPRELQIIKLVAKGYRNRQIADSLGIKVRTVEFHLANLYQMLDIEGRAGVVAKALRAGWINLDDDV